MIFMVSNKYYCKKIYFIAYLFGTINIDIFFYKISQTLDGLTRDTTRIVFFL
jgi:hypothetical protein